MAAAVLTGTANDSPLPKSNMSSPKDSKRSLAAKNEGKFLALSRLSLFSLRLLPHLLLSCFGPCRRARITLHHHTLLHHPPSSLFHRHYSPSPLPLLYSLWYLLTLCGVRRPIILCLYNCHPPLTVTAVPINAPTSYLSVLSSSSSFALLSLADALPHPLHLSLTHSLFRVYHWPSLFVSCLGLCARVQSGATVIVSASPANQMNRSSNDKSGSC